MQVLFLKFQEYREAWLKYNDTFWEKLIRILIYLGVILLPLFFIPLSTLFVEFTKIALFYLFIAVISFLWLLKILFNKKIKFELYFLDLTIFLFLLIYFFSCLFSADWYNSFIGLNFRYANSFLSICFFVLFYIIVSRFINTASQRRLIFQLAAIAVFLGLVFNNLQLVIPGLSFLSLNFSISTFNLLLLAGLIVAVILCLTGKKMSKIINLILAVIFLIYLYLIDNQNILLLLAFLIFLFILFLSFKSAAVSNRLIICLTAFLFLTVLVLILPINSYTGLISPVELKLPLRWGWEITRASLVDNPILGVGPQNFAFSFYRYKPLEFNQTDLWDFNFLENSNFALELLNNLGILAFILLLVAVFSLYKKYFSFIKKKIIENVFDYQDFLSVAGLMVLVSAFILFSFSDNFDFILTYYGFLFLGLLVGVLQPEGKSKFISSHNIIDFIVYPAALVIILFAYFAGRIFVSDYYFHRVLTSSVKEIGDFDKAEKIVKQATLFNPLYPDGNLKLFEVMANREVFRQKLAQEAGSAAPQADVSLKERINTQLNLALETKSNRVAYYRQLQDNIAALKDLSLNFHQQEKQINSRLLELDPNNPELYIDRALLNYSEYLYLKTQPNSQAENYQQIVEADLQKSLLIKNDYILAYYNLGLLYQEFNQPDKAREFMELAFNNDPSQKLVALDLKKLYLNQGKAAEASEVLNKYLQYSPGDSEVRLELAKIYKDNDKLEQALAEIKIILENQPDYQPAKDLLNTWQ